MRNVPGDGRQPLGLLFRDRRQRKQRLVLNNESQPRAADQCVERRFIRLRVLEHRRLLWPNRGVRRIGLCSKGTVNAYRENVVGTEMKFATVSGWLLGVGALCAMLGTQYASDKRQKEALRKADAALDLVQQI